MKMFHRQRDGPSTKRFDVAKLQGKSVDEKGRVKELWSSQGTMEEKWIAVKSALCDTAQSVLGTEKKQHPD